MAGKEVISEVVVRALDGAKDQPDMRAAGRALGTSARILSETVRTALLPLALVNLGVRKFEDYLRGKFADELDDATAGIPEESLQEPPLSIAGPVMQGLTFTHESETLRRMFLALLATSMDSSKDDSTHPAFVDIISQLRSDEAAILSALLAPRTGVPIIRYQRVDPTDVGSFTQLRRHVLPLVYDDEIVTTPVTNERLATFVDNWIRLNLIEVSYTHVFADERNYTWVENDARTLQLRAEHGELLEIVHGSLVVTDWGQSFAKAISPQSGPPSGYSFTGHLTDAS